MKTVEGLLEQIGPVLSTELTKALIKNGLSPEAARQQISRAKGNVRRLQHLTFPKNSRFIYLTKHYKSDQYWLALKNAVLGHPSYGPALSSLLHRQGVMPVQHFVIACGAPVKQKKHLAAEAILGRFRQAGLVEVVDTAGIGKCVVMSDLAKSGLIQWPDLKARLVTEDILLKAVQMWIRNLALASYNKVAIRARNKPLPRVGTFAWDLTGPSYVSGLVQWSTKRLKPGFITCDISLSGLVGDSAIQPFLTKCATLKSLLNIGRCLHIFVADQYTVSALRMAKGAGVVPATTSSLFGKDIAEGLKLLTTVLIQAATVAVKPETFEELFNKLGAIEGAAGNLRGALFEYIVADLVRHLEPGNVSLNKIVRDNSGKQAEVDVLIEQANVQTRFLECRGHIETQIIGIEEVKHWLHDRVPFIRAQALLDHDWKKTKLSFEYWTSGTLSPEAKALLDKAVANTKVYSVSYMDATLLKKYASPLHSSPLAKTLNGHYFQHPLAAMEKALAAKAARLAAKQQKPIGEEVLKLGTPALPSLPTKLF